MHKKNFKRYLFRKKEKVMKLFKQLGFFLSLTVFLCSASLDARLLEQLAPSNNEEINREKLLLLLSGEWVSRALYVSVKLEIADYLQSGPKTAQELAALTKANPESLSRVLHMLAGFDVFNEVAPNTFSNTEMGMLLTKSNPETLHNLAVFYGEVIHTSLDSLLDSIQTGTPAFQLTFNQPVFSYFKENPLKKALFQKSMKEKSMAVIRSALAHYDFTPYKTIYDIGGGYGHFMETLLSRYSHLKGALFELPEVIASIKEQNPELGNNRCELISGDFFKSLPKKGDLYLLKSVLHDWDDKQCEQILSNCHQAMDSNSRLLIIEVVLKPKGESIYANCMDVLMLAVTGGKERSLNDFEQMLDKTGFVIERIYPTSTEFSILEIKKK